MEDSKRSFLTPRDIEKLTGLTRNEVRYQIRVNPAWPKRIPIPGRPKFDREEVLKALAGLIKA